MGKSSSTTLMKEIQMKRKVMSNFKKKKKKKKLNHSIGSLWNSREIISNDRDEKKKLIVQFEDKERTKKRWLALGLFCALNCTQCCVWNSWGPIAETTMKAFPSWRKTSVALLSDWGCIMYLIFCLPCCWFLNTTDLSIPIRLAAILTGLATFLRCISSQEIIFTTTVHLAAILNGLSGVIIGPSIALVSAVWFPAGERTTATGISSSFNQLGIALSYLVGPALVGKPNDSGNSSTTDPVILRVQIMSLMRVEFVVQLIILIGVLWFFSKPIGNTFHIQTQSPKLGILESMYQLIRHTNVWCLCLAAAFSQGVTGPWLAMITLAFERSITQNEADNLAFWTVIFSSVLSLIISRIMDTLFPRHLKIAIKILLMISTATFFWIILLDYKILIFHKHELYVAVILGISTSWSTPALFLELASEIAFPVSEAIVGGYMIFLSNIVGAMFYFTYFIPGIGEKFSSCIIFFNLLVATILVRYVKDEYNRSKFQ